MDNFILKNINVISMINDKIEKKDIKIEENKVVATGENLEGDNRIDCTDKFVVPGYTDMHFHTTGENMDEMLLCIANGVTNIRVMWGNENVLRLREEAKNKDFICPNIYTASNIFDGNPPVFEGMTVIETPEEARQAVLDAKEKGYDFIKVYNNLLRPQFAEIVKTAKEVGMDVIGHRPVDVGTKGAIEGGQYCFEHEKSIQRDYLELAAKKGVYFDPTFIVSEVCNMIQEGKITEEHFTKGVAEYVNDATIKEWRYYAEFFKDYDFKLDRTHEEYLQDMIIFYKAGGKLLTGTDSGMPLVIPGFPLHDEFKILVNAGVSNFDVLKATTIDAAQCNHQDNLYGTVEVGKIANLVILNRNPLDDINNTKEIDAVILKGKHLDRAYLDKTLEDIKDRCNKTKEI